MLISAEDALGHKGKGPRWNENLRLIEKNNDLIDSFLQLCSLRRNKNRNKKINSIFCNPSHENIENLELFKNNEKFKDFLKIKPWCQL